LSCANDDDDNIVFPRPRLPSPNLSRNRATSSIGDRRVVLIGLTMLLHAGPLLAFWHRLTRPLCLLGTLLCSRRFFTLLRHTHDWLLPQRRSVGCLGGAVVKRSTPGRGAIKSTGSTQPSIPPG